MNKLIVLLLVLVASSCYYDNEEELYRGVPTPACDTTATTFQAVIKPIIDNNCAISGCHTDVTKAGNFSLQGYNNVKVKINDGTLLGSIKWEPGYSRMPQGRAQLPNCEILKIETWKNKGANDN